MRTLIVLGLLLLAFAGIAAAQSQPDNHDPPVFQWTPSPSPVLGPMLVPAVIQGPLANEVVDWQRNVEIWDCREKHPDARAPQYRREAPATKLQVDQFKILRS